MCFSKSVASHTKSCFWSDKNSLCPREVMLGSSHKYWFNCDKCHHDFEKRPTDLSYKKTWCPYCTNQKLCDDNGCIECYNKSFASHEKSRYWSKKNDKSPRQVFKQSKYHALFDCSCNHEFSIRVEHVARPSKSHWCSYCCNPPQKLCENYECTSCYNNSMASHPMTKYWGTKNTVIPRTVFKHSIIKYWFICDYCNEEYLISTINISKGGGCRKCLRKTQRLVLKFLNDNYDVEDEKKFEWSLNTKTNKYLKFDYFIQEYNCIIELDGEQHFREIKNWGSYDNIHKRDIIKTSTAIYNGYIVIRIRQEDVFNNTFDWKEFLKVNLRKHKRPRLICQKSYYYRSLKNDITQELERGCIEPICITPNRRQSPLR